MAIVKSMVRNFIMPRHRRAGVAAGKLASRSRRPGIRDSHRHGAGAVPQKEGLVQRRRYFYLKKILQYAVVLLGFGMNLSEILIQENSPCPLSCPPLPFPWWWPSSCIRRFGCKKQRDPYRRGLLYLRGIRYRRHRARHRRG